LAFAKLFVDLSFDHSAILITLNQEKEPILSNRHKNWDDFRRLVNERLTLNIPLKCKENIEKSARVYNDKIQCASWKSVPEHKGTLHAYDCPIVIP
jgi:hypothetical protein